MATPAKPTPLDVQVGQAVLALRRAQGLSMTALAQRAGTNTNQIHRVEQAKGSTTLRSLNNIAEALGMKLVVQFVPVGDGSGDNSDG